MAAKDLIETVHKMSPGELQAEVDQVAGAAG
jgi:hypothetical protein